MWSIFDWSTARVAQFSYPHFLSSIYPLSLLYLPSPLTSPPPLSLPNTIKFLCICNPILSLSLPPLSLSLQKDGKTALMLASQFGRTKAMKLLLTFPDINVNHADVSLYPPTPSHLVVGGEGEGDLPHLIPHSI